MVSAYSTAWYCTVVSGTFREAILMSYSIGFGIYTDTDVEIENRNHVIFSIAAALHSFQKLLVSVRG